MTIHPTMTLDHVLFNNDYLETRRWMERIGVIPNLPVLVSENEIDDFRMGHLDCVFHPEQIHPMLRADAQRGLPNGSYEALALLYSFIPPQCREDFYADRFVVTAQAPIEFTYDLPAEPAGALFNLVSQTILPHVGNEQAFKESLTRVLPSLIALAKQEPTLRDVIDLGDRILNLSDDLPDWYSLILFPLLFGYMKRESLTLVRGGMIAILPEVFSAAFILNSSKGSEFDLVLGRSDVNEPKADPYAKVRTQSKELIRVIQGFSLSI